MRLIRLFINSQFIIHVPLAISIAQAHYLIQVMRCRQGSQIIVFNGYEGEWIAELDIQKKGCFIIPRECKRPQPFVIKRIALIQGLIKRQDFIIEKTTELGVDEIFPIRMDHSVVTSMNLQKATTWAVEAAEQSERLTVPCIHPVTKLSALLDNWPEHRKILWAAERVKQHFFDSPIRNAQNDFAVLIGPEGGFSTAEQKYLKGHPAVIQISLGETILRSETAAIVALSLAIYRNIME